MSNGDIPPDQLPDIPVADLVSEAQQTVEGQKKAGFWESLWDAFWRSFVRGLSAIMLLLADVVEQIFILLGQFIIKAQGEETPHFLGLVGTIITDLTGIPIDSEKFKQAGVAGGRIGAMQEVGASLFNILVDEFTAPPAAGDIALAGSPPTPFETGLPAVALSEQQGLDGARRFLGFLMSFAVRQGNVSTLTELASVGFIKNFREYGETMARNLGLGRLARLALRPLMNETIATPLEWALKKQYRTSLLAEADVVKLVRGGLLDPADGVNTLARRGWSDANITAVFKLNTRRLSPPDLERLLRWQVIDENAALTDLKADGWDEDTARALLVAIELQRADARVEDEAKSWMKLFEDRFIDGEQLRTALDALPFTTREVKAMVISAENRIHVPHRSLTVAQLVTALTEATIDIEEFVAELRNEGYSADDAQILEIDALLKIADHAAAAKTKAARAATKKTKTPKPPPIPPIPPAP